jgi:hypothetical protein
MNYINSELLLCRKFTLNFLQFLGSFDLQSSIFNSGLSGLGYEIKKNLVNLVDPVKKPVSPNVKYFS